MGLLDQGTTFDGGGLLGPMTPDDQAAARSRALTALGAGLLAGRGNFSSILGNAVMHGQQAYDSGMDAAMRRRLMDSQLSENAAQARYRDMMLQAQQQKLAHDKALEDRQSRFWSGLGASADPAQAVIAQTGGLAPTRANAALMDQAPQGLRITPELVAQAAAAGIDIGNLQKIAESRNWNRDKVARTIEAVGPDGKPVTQQFTEYGQSVGIAVPKPYERKFQDMGGTVQGLDPYTGQPLGTGLAKSMTPDAVASNQLGWANNAETRANNLRMESQRQWERNNPQVRYLEGAGGFVAAPERGQNGQPPVASPLMLGGAVGGSLSPALGTKGIESAMALRKEFTHQPAVAKFTEVVPIVNSAYKAADTRAGDLNLIYGVGKVMDPTSVVREGELNLAIKAGSPAEQVQGMWNAVVGGGRLSPGQRADLMRELHTRAGELEQGYKAARGTYEGIASRQGIRHDDVFVGIPSLERGRADVRGQWLDTMPPAGGYPVGQRMRDSGGRYFRNNGREWVPE